MFVGLSLSFAVLQMDVWQCVEREHTCVYTKLSFLFTMLGTAVLFSLYSGMVVQS